jgi:chromosomal replication initiator protein
VDEGRPPRARTGGEVTEDRAQAQWERCAELVRAQVSESVWLTTFHDVRGLRYADGEFVLAVPSVLTKERIEHRFLSTVEAALEDADICDHRLVIEVHADLDGADDVELPIPPAPIVTAPPMVPLPAPAPVPAEPAFATPTMAINPEYTFENFVIASSNRFAHAAAMAVAEQPGKSYNPLILQGGVGLGKTHLLQAIVNFVRDIYPSFKVRYVSSETFLNDFVESIRLNTAADFKRRYREIDVLLVDDIQFLEGKNSLQEEFFHTFNSLHGAGRQIVMSSDRPPRAIATLEERLRSRFEWGLVADILPPDLETRLAILRKKNDHLAVPLPDDVLEFVADNILDNIRELEGALIRLSAWSSHYRQPPTVAVAREVLSYILGDGSATAITASEIIEAVVQRYGISYNDLIGKRRYRDLVQARQIAMYLCRELTNLSYPNIANVFGGRDHTTVIHAVRKVEQLMATKRQVLDDVTRLAQQLKNR